MKTFRELQNDVLRWYDEVDNEGEVRDNVKQALNAAQTARLAERNWPFMRWPAPARFSTVVGQRAYALHPEYFRPLYFYNVTQRKPMEEVFTDALMKPTLPSIEQWLDGGEDWTELTGTAFRFELKGMSPVQTQPSEASALTVSSSSTSDGSSQTITIVGDTADGVQEETIACGASGAAATGSVEFTNILRVTKSDNWSGTMTLKAGSTTLLTLFSSEMGRQHRVLYLRNEPTAVETIEYDFYRKGRRMEEDNDIPDIPEPFDDLLVYDALLDQLTYVPAEAAARAIWTERREKLANALIETYGEALSLERATGYVNYIPRD